MTAWQHIYANLERDRSPTKRAGFQTLFYSRDGLSENDVAEIEERVFYVFGEPNPVKRVFFRLKSDKVCIGQVVPVAGRDAAGREGLYIAHTLIFPTAVFQEMEINPIDYFNANLFVTSLAEAISSGDTDSGNINPVEVNLAPSPALDPAWDGAVFRKLAQLAINHEALRSDGSALALVGPAQEIEKTLASILLVVPPQLLTCCTFDTFFERGGNLSFTYCWCAGFLTRPRKPIYCVVDTVDKTIIGPDKHTNPATTYGRWVDARLASNNLQDIVINKREAFEIARSLDTPAIDPNILASFDAALVASVLDPE